MKKIFLLRHGESTGDIEKRYGGHYNDELTEKGHSQAATVAEKLSGESIQALYCSPLTRAQQTASYVSKKSNLPIKTIPDLIECNRYGVITGMTKEEALQSYPSELQKIDDRYAVIKDGESYEAFTARVKNTLNSIIKNEPSSSFVILTHGGYFRVLFREILKVGEISIEDGAYIALTAYDSMYTLEQLNGVVVKK